MRRFHVATEEEIRAGRVTDAYFLNAEKVLAEAGADKEVAAEVSVKRLPAGWSWAVLCGIEEVARLLEGLEGIEVDALPEGSLFHAGEPVLAIRGRYTSFCIHETALLGLLCQASGIATAAARCRIAAGEKLLLSFGARRQHPAVAPMVERAAWIGGTDTVSSVLGAELLGIPARGTMPHSMILVMGDTVEAAEAFDRIVDPETPRLVLIDTFQDEKFEALRVARALGDRLSALRLDTPPSRRGDLKALAEEIRWELDRRGFEKVKILVSGGIGEKEILELKDTVDGFGVGSFISRAPHVDFALDIVEVEGTPLAKRGKKSGRKDLLQCPACTRREVLPVGTPWTCPDCGNPGISLLEPLLRNGRITASLPPPRRIKERARKALENRNRAGRKNAGSSP